MMAIAYENVKIKPFGSNIVNVYEYASIQKTNNKHSNIKNLNANDFAINHTLKNIPEGIMVFHADWCGHCKALMPILIEYANKGGKVFMLESSEPNTEEIFSYYNIQGFPTIKLIKNGKILDIEPEGRSLQDLLKFLPISKKQTKKTHKRKRVNKRKYTKRKRSNKKKEKRKTSTK